MKILSYVGNEPTIDRGQTDKILEIFSRQLDVIQQIATTFVLIPRGTNLKEEIIKVRKPENEPQI